MLAEIVGLGGVLAAVVGVIELSYRLTDRGDRSLTAEEAVRQAMGGPEGNAVCAEFQRRGIAPPPRHRPWRRYLL